jgi:phenylpropionate dioxygenase-like ring-hydroxylating dioxygenase large terminal subunit
VPDRTAEAVRDRTAEQIDGGPVERRQRLGLRDRIPASGLTEYWYPAVTVDNVGRRPVSRRMLGREIVFFRGEKAEVVALTNWCPHRNASLARGKCHFIGTITCPYHGATFDASGKPVAFLGEGPDSKWCDQGGTAARAYPTRSLKGLVFVWMGDGDPAPIEEDVPPEFFDDNSLVMFSEQEWKTNWRVSLENLQDAHVFYVHRNSIELLSQDESSLRHLADMGPDRPPTKVINNRALVFDNTRYFDFADTNLERKATSLGPFRRSYPGLKGALYPKTENRLRLSKVMGYLRKRFRTPRDWLMTDPEWGQCVHLPTIFRNDHQSHIYTRTVTPIDAHNSRVFYYTTSYPRSPRERLRNKVIFHSYYNWKQHKNFSGQDKHIVEHVLYENPRERFSTSDAFPLAWRRMVIDHGRRPPEGAKTTPDEPIEIRP